MSHIDINNIESICAKLEDTLTKHRFEHTLGVSNTAIALAMCYGEDFKKAQIAGLLHDNAKCLSDEKILKKCQKHNIDISQIEYEQPFLLHAKLGAYYAKTKYEIEDLDIENAIKYHTTGRPDMSILEKIVFVADYIEPGRDKAKNLKEIRQEAFRNIDKAIYMILKDTIDYLKENKKLIDDMSIKTFEYYKKIGDKDEFEGKSKNNI